MHTARSIIDFTNLRSLLNFYTCSPEALRQPSRYLHISVHNTPSSVTASSQRCLWFSPHLPTVPLDFLIFHLRILNVRALKIFFGSFVVKGYLRGELRKQMTVPRGCRWRLGRLLTGRRSDVWGWSGSYRKMHTVQTSRPRGGFKFDYIIYDQVLCSKQCICRWCLFTI